MTKPTFLHRAAIAATLTLAAGFAAAAPCDSADHRAFDFWVGDWEVRGPAGQVAGTNRITSEYGGCVVHEHYDTGKGYRGESLNTYDAARQVWHQTWVDVGGLLLVLEGGMRGGRMVLEGQTANPGQPATKHRITWTPNADGTVRQFWESTDAKGDWGVAFDGLYTRKPGASR